MCGPSLLFGFSFLYDIFHLTLNMNKSIFFPLTSLPFVSEISARDPRCVLAKGFLSLLTIYTLQFNLASGETKYIPKCNPTPK